ncbi:MAG: hypothetical protein M1829_004650 [Trizodia sp. TS-e1964]|nr:MAG: hypothetical protein M1829_004650 [Trizodia sp. TS-e1964]
MLKCKACQWRYISASRPSQSRVLQPRGRGSPFSRRHYSNTPILQDIDNCAASSTAESSPAAQDARPQEKAAKELKIIRDGDLKLPPSILNSVAYQIRDPRSLIRHVYKPHALQKELQYLRDPLKLSNYVRDILASGDHEKAVNIIRAASRDMDCVVSWNLLIQNHMTRKAIVPAFKVYNEMKKRGQQPDAYTYTHLLKGLAANARLPLSLGRALALYESMFSPKSVIKPNLYHTNTILQICGAAGDLDSLLGIAAKMPVKGPGSANTFTWTIILHSMWKTAVLPRAEGVSGEEAAKQRANTVIEARRIWGDIVGRWRAGDLWVDERLACTMARLLLITGKVGDAYDTLALFEQTMGIPRLFTWNPQQLFEQKMGLTNESTALTTTATATATTTRDTQPEAAHVEATAPHHKRGEPDLTPGSEFKPLPELLSPRRPRGKWESDNQLNYAGPSKHTLAIIIEACNTLSAKKAAIDYWELLTSEYGVNADINCYIHLFRILRAARASSDIVHYMEKVQKLCAADPSFAVAQEPALHQGRRHEPKSDPPTKSLFRIAMSACARDTLNTHTFENAKRVYNAMLEMLPSPSVPVMQSFLLCAAKFASKNHGSVADIQSALDMVVPSLARLGIDLDQDPPPREQLHQRYTEEMPSVEILDLIQAIVGAYDRLLVLGADEKPVESAERQLLVDRRARAAAIITRWSVSKRRVYPEGEGKGPEEGKALEERESGSLKESGLPSKARQLGQREGLAT